MRADSCRIRPGRRPHPPADPQLQAAIFPLPKANHSLIKANDPLIKANDPLIKANDSPIKANDPLIKANKPLIKANDSLIKANDPLIKANKPLIKANDSLIKANKRLRAPFGQPPKHPPPEIEVPASAIQVQSPEIPSCPVSPSTGMFRIRYGAGAVSL
jgi:hypothetical protein